MHFSFTAFDELSTTRTGQGKNLTYEQFWGTDSRSLDRESEVVRSKRGLYTVFNRKNVWDRPKSFIQEGCSPDQSVR